MVFYLGTHRVHWLGRLMIPLFISERILRGRRKLTRARCRWALDSGGFSELSLFGKWTISAKQYAVDVRRYMTFIGRLDWAAIQDWMCEPYIRDKTGLSIKEHQDRTIQSYIELHELAPDIPFAPVLQGWEVADYHKHVEAYDKAGISLYDVPVVGVGSVCRRQGTNEGLEIFNSLSSYGFGLHGFGVKSTALAKASNIFQSADSMAWSMSARYSPPLPGHRHKTCANCLTYALRWRKNVLDSISMGEDN